MTDEKPSKVMTMGGGKKNADGRRVLTMPRQGNKLSRRMVRDFNQKFKSSVGKKLVGESEPKPRALSPKERRRVRREELERRAMAQDNVVMMDQIDAPRIDATKTEREILVLDQDDDAITLEGSIGLSSEPLGFVQRKID